MRRGLKWKEGTSIPALAMALTGVVIPAAQYYCKSAMTDLCISASS